MDKSRCLLVNGGFEGDRTATRKSRHRPAHARDAGSVRAALRCNHRYPLKSVGRRAGMGKAGSTFQSCLSSGARRRGRSSARDLPTGGAAGLELVNGVRRLERGNNAFSLVKSWPAAARTTSAVARGRPAVARSMSAVPRRTPEVARRAPEVARNAPLTSREKASVGEGG